MRQSIDMGGPVRWKVDRQTGRGLDWWTGEVASGLINRYRQTDRHSGMGGWVRWQVGGQTETDLGWMGWWERWQMGRQTEID